MQKRNRWGNISPTELKARMLEQCIVQDDCWLYQGKLNKDGYAICPSSILGASTLHRAMFIQLRGLIPDSFECHHTCRNRHCINPWHLQLMTHADHLSDESFWGAKTHCKHGHKYEEGNIIWRTSRKPHTMGKRIWRDCKECKRAYERRLYAKNKCKLVADTRA